MPPIMFVWQVLRLPEPGLLHGLLLQTATPGQTASHTSQMAASIIEMLQLSFAVIRKSRWKETGENSSNRLYIK